MFLGKKRGHPEQTANFATIVHDKKSLKNLLLKRKKGKKGRKKKEYGTRA